MNSEFVLSPTGDICLFGQGVSIGGVGEGEVAVLSLCKKSLRSPERYIAIHEFQTTRDDEIDLQKGDVVLVVKKYQDGWFRGVRCRGYQVGCFPGNFVAIDASPGECNRSPFSFETPPPLPAKQVRTARLIDLDDKPQVAKPCPLSPVEGGLPPELPAKHRDRWSTSFQSDLNHNSSIELENENGIRNEESQSYDHNSPNSKLDEQCASTSQESIEKAEFMNFGKGIKRNEEHRNSTVGASSFMGLQLLQSKDSSEDTAEKRRTRAAEELLTSEMSYFSGLNMLISSLAFISKEMVSKLQSRLAKWDVNTTIIGDVLLEMFSYLKLFEPYFNSRNKGNEVKSKLEKNNEKFRLISTRTINGQTLNSLLLMPIQRIPRYELLLKELVKRTDESHPDYGNLKEAQAKAQKAAAELNEHIRRIENESKIIEVMKSFPNDELNLIHAANTHVRTTGTARIKKQERQQMATLSRKIKRNGIIVNRVKKSSLEVASLADTRDNHIPYSRHINVPDAQVDIVSILPLKNVTSSSEFICDVAPLVPIGYRIPDTREIKSRIPGIVTSLMSGWTMILFYLYRMSLPLASSIETSPHLPRSATASPIPGVRERDNSDSDSDSESPGSTGDTFSTSVFLYEGAVERVTRKATGSSEGGMVHETVERYLFLFDNVLLVSAASDNVLTGKRTFKLKNDHPLNQSWVASPLAYYTNPPETMFLFGTPLHVYKFLAASVREKETWERELKKAIDKEKEQLVRAFQALPLPNQQFTAVTLEAKIDYNKTVDVELNLRQGEEVLVVGFKPEEGPWRSWQPGLYPDGFFDLSLEWQVEVSKRGKCGQVYRKGNLAGFQIHPIPTAVALNQIQNTMRMWTGSHPSAVDEVKVVKIYRPDKTFKTCKVESDYQIKDVLRQYSRHKSFCGADIDVDNLELWEESLDGSGVCNDKIVIMMLR
ncbi:predicted protein [Nematostella vectensis]|uniref:Uncharacterized protein n=1 Tax=Nematostella vectensis TaxID=45351 RepID=A7RJS1_NEMVE|nr:predicted protein [Nematostella vectensis]|eukprot:XP_001640381.1 predicted protein [Nematostella vectensis]